MWNKLAILGFAAVMLTRPTSAQHDALASSAVTIRDTFGEAGLLEMPSAHVARDGQIAFTAAALGQQQRYTLTFQAASWLEAAFRFSHVVGLHEGYDDTHFYDRSFAAKIRLLRENEVLPDLAIGLRDILGTGVYSSEYAVASKHVGPLDLTVGLGWGKLAERESFGNPIGVVYSQASQRPALNYGNGGVPNFSTFFRGSVGVFGGVIWQTPVDGLSTLVEYSSTKYAGYTSARALKVRSPINIGLSYSPVESAVISAGWYYGSAYGVTLSLSGDPTQTYPSAVRIGPSIPPPAVRSDIDQRNALVALESHRKRVTAGQNDGAWVHVPSAAEHARDDLLQKLMITGYGVRDISVSGSSLVVDAPVHNDSAHQCAVYNQIAFSGQTPFKTVAVTDLQDPAGIVTFCPVKTASNRELQQHTNTALGGQNAALDEIHRKLEAGLADQYLKFDALEISSGELWIYYENYKYLKESEAIGRVVRVLMASVPSDVEIFHLISVRLGVPLRQVTVNRSGMERVILNGAASSETETPISLSPPPWENRAFYRDVSSQYPQLSWALDPKLTEHLYDPDAPLQLMVYADATGLVQIAPGFLLAAQVTATVWTNYKFTRDAGSALPHVRTDLLKYLDKGRYGIAGLNLVYRTQVAQEISTEFRAGYLEDMFMGAGAQVLWRPLGSRLSYGADIYQVWQRDYNRLFGTRAYSVLTGHASIYYETPWNNLNFQLHAGRYLAGDYGATLEISRRFESGVEIGAWATFTNVPFSKFGEGSFDKGIIIHIPFEWGLPIYSQSAYDLRMSSLTRDGGQRLLGGDSLFEATRAASYGEILGSLDHVVEP